MRSLSAVPVVSFNCSFPAFQLSSSLSIFRLPMGHALSTLPSLGPSWGSLGCLLLNWPGHRVPCQCCNNKPLLFNSPHRFILSPLQHQINNKGNITEYVVPRGSRTILVPDRVRSHLRNIIKSSVVQLKHAIEAEVIRGIEHAILILFVIAIRITVTTRITVRTRGVVPFIHQRLMIDTISGKQSEI